MEGRVREFSGRMLASHQAGVAAMRLGWLWRKAGGRYSFSQAKHCQLESCLCLSMLSVNFSQQVSVWP